MQTSFDKFTAQKTEAAKCPFDHNALSQQKTAQVSQASGPAITQDESGTWQIRGFQEARTILRSGNTRQAGFNSEEVGDSLKLTNPPVLFMDGKAHQQQRKQTARFFAPKTVSSNYRKLMEELTDQIVAEVRTRKQVDLAGLSLKLAVRVAAEVVGLTNSRLPGMTRRIEAFLNQPKLENASPLISRLFNLWNQRRMLSFFFLDVKPAIAARKHQPQEDVISHLIEQNYSDTEILIECITYGAAGMATTREFISIATWHFLEQPELRERYLAGSEAERYAILHEILRLEPVVSHLYRRATADITLESDGNPVIIHQGELIDLHIYDTNADPRVVGEQPRALCPGRELKAERAAAEMLSFGDGNHRCPGAYIAIQETDILLRKLLALPGLRFEQKPAVKWNESITSYEIRDFMITVN